MLHVVKSTHMIRPSQALIGWRSKPAHVTVRAVHFTSSTEKYTVHFVDDTSHRIRRSPRQLEEAA